MVKTLEMYEKLLFFKNDAFKTEFFVSKRANQASTNV